MKKAIILLTFLMLLKCVDAQQPIGVKYDVNGMPFNGYFDPIIYAPKKKIMKVHNSDSYEIGYYYDKSGHKISGMLNFQGKKIWFMKGEDEHCDKIKPQDVSYFVIGVDSFFTVSKYFYKNKLKTTPIYVQYISEFGDYTVAKHYSFDSMAQGSVIESFLIKSADEDTWEKFPGSEKNAEKKYFIHISSNKTFKEEALKYFGYIPCLKSKIASGDYGNRDMMSIVKMAEYHEKYKGSTPILYDKYWQEVRDVKNSEYRANITSIKDSIWTFEYYKNSTKLYKVNYSSFYPNIKNGDFIAYYPNGKVRQRVSFLDNKPKEVKVFNDKGILRFHYQITGNEDENPKNNDIDIKYIVVNDALGNNILKSQGKSSLDIFDAQNNSRVVATFANNKLVESYRIYKNDTLFQIVNADYKFKVKSLQRRFDFFMSDKQYDKALSEGAQGTVLLSLIIDPKGYVIKASALNKVHPEIDKLMEGFISRKMLEGADFRHKFKPYKKGKIKQYYELVIPFEFSINKFYRESVYYNHFDFFHQMNQQMHNTHSLSLPPGL